MQYFGQNYHPALLKYSKKRYAYGRCVKEEQPAVITARRFLFDARGVCCRGTGEHHRGGDAAPEIPA